MKRAFAAALLLATLIAAPAVAQDAPRAPRAPRPLAAPRPPAPSRAVTPEPAVYDGNAQELRQSLGDIMRQYPPSLGQVLRLDPTLLTNPAYLEPYPPLAAFLGQHPEIAHNPGFFVGEARDGFDRADQRVAALRDVEGTLDGLGFLIGFLTVVGTIGWLLRSVIEHRRWLRVSKTHTDTHTKLIDRLTSNEDLLAYMQSPAGRHFLEAAPIPLDAGPRALSAPLGRILWSAQAGLVVAFAGAGLMFASRRFAGHITLSEVELPLFVLSAVLVSIGVGFVISSLVAYALSRRLNLLTPAQNYPAADPGASHLS